MINGLRNASGILLAGRQNVTVKNCNIINFTHGIFLDSSSANFLMGNILTSNTIGIRIFSSNFNNIINNTIEINSGGIVLHNLAASNIIKSNIIISNVNQGIFSSDGLNNLIYNNYFNNYFNVLDYGSNFWNITRTKGKNIIGGPIIAGNFWHNYAGQDTNNDGIGDTLLPYNSNRNIQIGGDYAPLVQLKAATRLSPKIKNQLQKTFSSPIFLMLILIIALFIIFLKQRK